MEKDKTAYLDEGREASILYHFLLSLSQQSKILSASWLQAFRMTIRYRLACDVYGEADRSHWTRRFSFGSEGSGLQAALFALVLGV